MGNNWTKEQLSVIENRNSDLLVSAAAGSGKTAVLIERIIQLILDKKNPIDIDKLLVVTFTKAAASEMRERVGVAIEKALEKDPLNEHLQKQLLLLNTADITTIDSFCKSVLTSKAHLVNLDSNFKVIEPSENELLAREVMDELFDELYEEGNEKFLNLVRLYSSKSSDRELTELLLNVNNFVNSYPFPEDWLNEKAEFFNGCGKDDNFYVKNYTVGIVKEISINLDFYFSNINHILKTLDYEELKKYVDIYKDFIKSFKTVKESINDFLIREDFESFNTLSEVSKEFSDIKLNRFTISKNVNDNIKALYSSAKDEINDMKKEIFSEIKKLSVDISDIKQENEIIYPLVRAISDVVLSFREKFKEKKRKLNLVNFSDIEHFTLEILTQSKGKNEKVPSKTAKEYQEKYFEVFVDEYQDSNRVQEIILSMVSKRNPPNRFMVGDVKQSIYRFRQADPSIFMEKYEKYSSLDEDKNSKNKKIMLYANFRSRAEVLEGTNHIFSQIMRKETGELDYTEDEKLNPKAVFEECDKNVGGSIEIHLVDEFQEADENFDTVDFLEDEKELDEIKSFKQEALNIANIINRLVDEKNEYMVYDKDLKKYRKVKYKDIVILMRSPSGNAKILEEILSSCDIPVFVENSGGYFETFEVDTVVNLLKIIDNPMQDIALVSVMRSAIYNFTDKELAKIRLKDRNLNFYRLLSKINSENESDKILKNKVRRFMNDLENFRGKSTLFRTDELLWYILKNTGYYDYVGLLEMGERRQSNLMLLFEKAVQYEKNSYKGLFNFINFIEKLKLKSSDTSEAKLVGEDANVIRLMSIHKSKGLEFPIVILANSDKKFNFRENNSKLILHQDLGYGAVVYDLKKKVSFNSMMKRKIERIQKKEQIAEEMRLLYVAMTRAKEKLIISARTKNYKKSLEKWKKSIGEKNDKINSFKILNADNYLEWIMFSFLKLEPNTKELNCFGEEKIFFGENNLKFMLEVQKLKDVFDFYNHFKSEKISKKEQYIESFKSFESKSKDIDISEFLNDRFNFKYKYESSIRKPSSISVSEVKKIIQENENNHQELYLSDFSFDLKTPNFIHDQKNKVEFNSAQKGTIFHLVMQLLDFKKFENADVYEEIRLQLENLIKNNILSKEEVDTINLGWIFNFVNSKMFREILSADKKGKLFKEKAINYNLSLKELYDKTDINDDEKLMVVGIIDLFFENDNGEIILIDYKTDYVTEKNLNKIKEKYKIQLKLYKYAIERNSKKRVSKKGIYLFGIDKFIEI